MAQTPPLFDYVLLDARAGIEFGHVELAAYAENLLDESYIVFAAFNAGVNNVLRYNIPRRYGVTMRYTF